MGLEVSEFLRLDFVADEGTMKGFLFMGVVKVEVVDDLRGVAVRDERAEEVEEVEVEEVLERERSRDSVEGSGGMVAIDVVSVVVVIAVVVAAVTESTVESAVLRARPGETPSSIAIIPFTITSLPACSSSDSAAMIL